LKDPMLLGGTTVVCCAWVDEVPVAMTILYVFQYTVCFVFYAVFLHIV
jgi:hypothetical protein